MNVDIAQQLGAIRRAVFQREHEGRPAWVLTASRTYDTHVDDLWDALTDRQRIPRWFLPISGDLRLGGRYQLEGNAGGEITRCEPPRALAVTWEHGGGVSWVTVTLTAEGERTHLDLEHVAHVPEELWGTYGPGATGIGWELTLLGLALHLASGAPVDPAEATRWPETPDGRTFVAGASDGWREASVAAGTDPETARAGAERVAAFYSGAST